MSQFTKHSSALDDQGQQRLSGEVKFAAGVAAGLALLFGSLRLIEPTAEYAKYDAHDRIMRRAQSPRTCTEFMVGFARICELSQRQEFSILGHEFLALASDYHAISSVVVASENSTVRDLERQYTLTARQMGTCYTELAQYGALNQLERAQLASYIRDALKQCGFSEHEELDPESSNLRARFSKRGFADIFLPIESKRDAPPSTGTFEPNLGHNS